MLLLKVDKSKLQVIYMAFSWSSQNHKTFLLVTQHSQSVSFPQCVPPCMIWCLLYGPLSPEQMLFLCLPLRQCCCCRCVLLPSDERWCFGRSRGAQKVNSSSSRAGCAALAIRHLIWATSHWVRKGMAKTSLQLKSVTSIFFYFGGVVGVKILNLNFFFHFHLKHAFTIKI